MRIDLSKIDTTQFVIKQGTFCDIPAVLVTPAMQGTVWTQLNKHLRSSIWDLEGNLLSAGFPKFTNVGENPEHFPMPKSLDNALCVEKCDGSLAIFDYVNDTVSCRTRGTFTCATLDNAPDFALALAKYPLIKTMVKHVPEVSWLFEITTPNQRIVVDYGPEVELTFIGGVRKRDYTLPGQDVLDSLARSYKLKRPRYFTFSSLDHLLSDVKTWEGLEGCVIYSPAGMHKAKADSYLRKHRFKEHATLRNTVEIWFTQGRPSQAEFEENLTKQFDHECMTLVKDHVQSIAEQATILGAELGELTLAIEPLKPLTRKDAALHILANHASSQAAAFQLLNSGQVQEKTYRHMLEEKLGL